MNVFGLYATWKNGETVLIKVFKTEESAQKFCTEKQRKAANLLGIVKQEIWALTVE